MGEVCGEEGEEAGRSTHEPWALLCPAVLSAEMRANGEVAPAPSLLPAAVVKARPAVVLMRGEEAGAARPVCGGGAASGQPGGGTARAGAGAQQRRGGPEWRPRQQQ